MERSVRVSHDTLRQRAASRRPRPGSVPHATAVATFICLAGLAALAALLLAFNAEPAGRALACSTVACAATILVAEDDDGPETGPALAVDAVAPRRTPSVLGFSVARRKAARPPSPLPPGQFWLLDLPPPIRSSHLP